MISTEHRILIVLIGASGVGKSTLVQYAHQHLADRVVVLHRQANRPVREQAEGCEVVEVTDAALDAAREANELATYYERYTHRYGLRFDELARVPKDKVGLVVLPAVAIPMLRKSLGASWDVFPCWLDITPENRAKRYVQREDEESKSTQEARLAVAPIDHSKIAEVKIDANGTRATVVAAFVAWLNKIRGASYCLSTEALQEAETVFQTLSHMDVTWCLFGGLAARWYGLIDGRPPTDMDILVQTDDLTEIAKALPGFERRRDTILQGKFLEIRAAQLRLHVAGQPFPWRFDTEAASRLGRCRVGCWVVPVISAEDTVVMKCVLQRGTDRGKADVADVVSVLTARGARLDKEYMVWRAEQCQSKDRVLDCLAQLGCRITK